MRGSVLGRRYAKALFELTQGGPDSAAIATLLSELGEALEQKGPLADVVFNPRYPFQAKEAVLTQFAQRVKAGPTAVTFLGLLLKKNRFDIVPAIAAAYQELLDEAAGRQRVAVTTAKPLDAKEEAALKQRLEATTRRTVVLDLSVDPELIGGIVVRTGSLAYDGSVKGQLERLRQRLLSA